LFKEKINKIVWLRSTFWGRTIKKISWNQRTNSNVWRDFSFQTGGS